MLPIIFQVLGGFPENIYNLETYTYGVGPRLGLRWANADGGASIELYADAVLIGTFPPGTTEYETGDIEPYATYTGVAIKNGKRALSGLQSFNGA